MKNVELVKFLKDHKNRGRVEIVDSAEVELSDEIKDIAKKRGIDLDNCDRDFAFFKNIYALTDVANANKCILPKEKIEPILSSIVLKPIDIDHIRSYTVGVYLDATIEDNIIYAYGIIFKANFAEEWEEAQRLFNEGKLTSSFEIWCPQDKRTQYDDGTFSLDEPVMAGGAILFKTEPAFKEAHILEVAKKNIDKARKNKAVDLDYLVAASIDESSIINASYCIYDNYEIQNMIDQVECPECGCNWWDITKIDYENKTAEAKCWECELRASFNLVPDMKKIEANDLNITENSNRKSYKDCDFAFVNDKLRMFLITDKENIDISLSKLDNEKTKQYLTKIGANVEKIKETILNKSTELIKEETEMEEKIKELEAEIAKLKADAGAVEAKIKEQDEAIASKDEEIKTLTEAQEKLSEEAQKQLEEAKAEIEAEIEKAKADAKVVAERKVELADFAKEMSDEDLLNDDKYELAKKDKEIAELKAKVGAKKEEKKDEKEVSSVRGQEKQEISELEQAQIRVKDIAWNRNK